MSVSLDNEGCCKQMRLAARWQDIHSIVEQQATLSPSATAFALHRLGCLFVYLSWQRRAGERSVPILIRPWNEPDGFAPTCNSHCTEATALVLPHSAIAHDWHDVMYRHACTRKYGSTCVLTWLCVHRA